MAHAIYAPSSASRWTECGASIVLSAFYPDTTNPAAEFGTDIHEACEIILNLDDVHSETAASNLEIFNKYPDRFDEIYMHITNYLGYVSDLKLLSNVECQIEKRVHVSSAIYGTADCIAHDTVDNVLYVIDLKTGRVGVSAENNLQLSIYALGAIAEMGGAYSTIETVVLVIAQATNSEKPIDEWVVPDHVDYFKNLSKKLSNAVSKAEQYKSQYAEFSALGADAFKTGDWCKYCKALANCPARNLEIQAYIKPDMATMPNVYELSADKITKILDAKPLIEKYLKAVEEIAKTKIEFGENLSGYTLKDSVSNRSWIDENKVRNYFSEHHPDKIGLIDQPSVLKSPAQLEKLIIKNKKDLLKFTTRHKIGTRLVKTKASNNLIEGDLNHG